MDTHFLERFALPAPDPQLHRVHCVAAALAAAEARRGVFPSGWRNVRSQPQTVSFSGTEVAYARTRAGVEVSVDGEPLDVVVWGASPSYVDMSVAGIRRRYDVTVTPTAVHVDSPLGHTALVEDPLEAGFDQAAVVMHAGCSPRFRGLPEVGHKVTRDG